MSASFLFWRRLAPFASIEFLLKILQVSVRTCNPLPVLRINAGGFDKVHSHHQRSGQVNIATIALIRTKVLI